MFSLEEPKVFKMSLTERRMGNSGKTSWKCVTNTQFWFLIWLSPSRRTTRICFPSCSRKQTHFLHSLFVYKMLPFVCASDVGTIKGWTQIEKTLMCFNLIMLLLPLPPLAVCCPTCFCPFSFFRFGFDKKSRQTVCAPHGWNVTTSRTLNLRAERISG